MHAESQLIAFYIDSFLQIVTETEERKLTLAEAYTNGLDFHAIVVHSTEISDCWKER